MATGTPEKQQMPDYIARLVKDLPVAGLSYRETWSEIISCGGSVPVGDRVPVTILRAEISQSTRTAGYAVLAERISLMGDNMEFALVIKDHPGGKEWLFATGGVQQLTGLPPDVVCEERGRFTRGLLESIFEAAKSFPGQGRNLIPAVSATLAELPF